MKKDLICIFETGLTIWFSEVAANKDNSLPSKNLLVLGDKESGKTTLLAKLQGNEDPKKGSGLEFGYIDVRDDDCEDHTLLNHAVLDGDVAHANLLQFALTEENYVDTTVLICASMAAPWSIIDQLNKWIGVLQVLRCKHDLFLLRGSIFYALLSPY